MHDGFHLIYTDILTRTRIRVISKAGTPLARLIPYHLDKKPRSPGFWQGQVTMTEDFDEPLPPDILAGFLGIDE